MESINYTQIPSKLVILSHFISWKTHFLILAGSAFCQIWIGWLTAPQLTTLIIFGKRHFLLISKMSFSRNKMCRNYKFAWNSCEDHDFDNCFQALLINLDRPRCHKSHQGLNLDIPALLCVGIIHPWLEVIWLPQPFQWLCVKRNWSIGDELPSTNKS